MFNAMYGPEQFPCVFRPIIDVECCLHQWTLEIDGSIRMGNKRGTVKYDDFMESEGIVWIPQTVTVTNG